MEVKGESEAKKRFSLHKVFVDLSLENDLEGEELEWFKSRIRSKEVDGEVEDDGKNREKAGKKVEILSEEEIKKREDKSGKRLLKMRETDTEWLLSLETCFSQDDPKDAERIRRENELYLKKKKLIRNRRSADAQTVKGMERSRWTSTGEIKMIDSVVLASEWDLFDTRKALGESDEKRKSTEIVSETPDLQVPSGSSRLQIGSPPPPQGDEAEKVLESSNFKYAALVTERLLASNRYRSQQTEFKKFLSRYDEEPTDFSYRMEPLWNFERQSKPFLMVTDMDWNPLNQDLLAVGYGNLNFLEKTSGLVCIWSPKNPRQPEREFLLEQSVTCLNHSRTRPNVLAVGTRSGQIYVLDVSRHGGCTRLLPRSENSKPLRDPVWKVEWFLHRELIFEREELLSVSESGLLNLFSFSTEEPAADLLRLDYVVSRENCPGKNLPGKDFRQRKNPACQSYDRKTFSGLSFSICTDRHFCYISTKEGVLVKCNLRNPSMMDGVFSAHDGPVHLVSHSPVTDLIYLTCGVDWTVRIWMEGITRPLLTLQNKAPVRCARWSPTIPTMIATIGDADLSLWDISRNVLSPVSKRSFQDSRRPFSTVLFSWNGMNVVIGGEDGRVRVVHLSQLPKIPFLQKEALIEAIKNGLRKNKALTVAFSRMVETNRDRLKTEVVVQ